MGSFIQQRLSNSQSFYFMEDYFKHKKAVKIIADPAGFRSELGFDLDVYLKKCDLFSEMLRKQANNIEKTNKNVRAHRLTTGLIGVLAVGGLALAPFTAGISLMVSKAALGTGATVILKTVGGGIATLFGKKESNETVEEWANRLSEESQMLYQFLRCIEIDLLCMDLMSLRLATKKYRKDDNESSPCVEKSDQGWARKHFFFFLFLSFPFSKAKVFFFRVHPWF